jgi:hypothetical protein
MAEAKIKEAENKIKKEQFEKHKLLNDPNEITRNAAQELHDLYLKASKQQIKHHLIKPLSVVIQRLLYQKRKKAQSKNIRSDVIIVINNPNQSY